MAGHNVVNLHAVETIANSTHSARTRQQIIDITLSEGHE